MPESGPPQEVGKPEAPIVDIPTELTKQRGSPPKPRTQRVFPESAIASPEKDAAARHVAYDTLLSARVLDTRFVAGWQFRRTRQGKIVGFEFSNSGGNPMLPPRRDAVKNQFFTRDFQFRFDDRARQDIHLMVADWVASRDRQFRLSELMNSLLHFFPRVTLPAIVNIGALNIVTLPTGEEVAFDAATHEIRDGVLAERPVDLNPDRSARNFPGIDYRGRGVTVRADARGADPRIGTTAVITNSARAPACASGTPCARCEVASREIWEQSGAMRFRFASDDDFDRFLLARCGFGLPTKGGKFAIASSSK